VKLEVGEEHLNINEIAHRRVVFTVRDEAFELAGNSHGTTAVALSMSINYPRPTKAGKKISQKLKKYPSPKEPTSSISNL